LVLPGGSDTTITDHTQTKHSTQNYTCIKGHTTHTEYNANIDQKQNHKSPLNEGPE
jgi:hypothetical protein